MTTVIVTGAGGDGCGRAIAARFAAGGAAVVASDIDEAGGAATIRLIERSGGRAAIRVNCLAPGWIATENVRQYWESLTPSERSARGVPSRLLSVDQIAEMVVRLASDRSLAGRVVVWWSEDAPKLIEWGDRGYWQAVPF